MRKHGANVVVIGNGTGSRETEEVVVDFIAESGADVRYTIVNEAGASVYSASKLASEEYPDLDVTTRGAMSLGRRLQDPLAELVKIPPQSIGVGQYQHDLNAAALERALTGVVENVVNRVGVDLNTASASLLGYVAGVSTAVAKKHRGLPRGTRRVHRPPPAQEGSEAGREGVPELRRLPAHLAAARTRSTPRASTPRSYDAARAVLARAGVKPEALARGGVPDIWPRASATWATLAAELGVGAPTLADIIAELEKPGRDPRDDAPEVVFSRSVRDFDDLDRGHGAHGHRAQRGGLRRVRGRGREAGRPRAHIASWPTASCATRARS